MVTRTDDGKGWIGVIKGVGTIGYGTTHAMALEGTVPCTQYRLRSDTCIAVGQNGIFGIENGTPIGGLEIEEISMEGFYNSVRLTEWSD